jgi:hypothetical protein
MEDADNLVFLAVGLLYRALRLPLPPSVLGTSTFNISGNDYTYQLSRQQALEVNDILWGDGDLNLKAELIRELRADLWSQVWSYASRLSDLLTGSKESLQRERRTALTTPDPPPLGCCHYDSTEEVMSLSNCTNVYKGTWDGPGTNCRHDGDD